MTPGRRALVVAALCLWASAGRAVPLEGTSAPPPARFVVVLGYNGAAGDERPQLRYADDDAARFFLQTFPGAERAWLLTTFDTESARAFGALAEQATAPTSQQLARVLGEASWLIRKARQQGRGTELVFYFAGHGDVSPGGEGYVVLADGGFTRSDLDAQVVQASPADVNHVLLDACASYFMVSRGDGATSERVPLTPDLLDVLKSPAGPATRDPGAWSRTGVLVSTSSAAEVHESAEVGGGVFSYLLRSALAGGADSNGDGVVEYSEAAAFVAAAGAALDDPRARLRIHARAPVQRPHTALVDLRDSGAEHFLVVDAHRPVHLRILDARGVPWVELHRDGTEPVLLALVGNPFFIVQREGQEAVLVPRRAGAYALSSLAFADGPAPRGPRTGSFAGLFLVEYGGSFLQGYLARADAVPPLSRPPFEVGFAPAGAPPFRVPWWPLASGAFASAGVLAAIAGGCAVGNALAFSELEKRFHATGTLDPALSLQADSFLTGAAVLSVGALAALAAGGGLSVVALTEEDVP